MKRTLPFGYIRIEAVGYNQGRLLSKLSEENIKLERIEKVSEKQMFFNVKEKHSKKTFAILEKLCYNYKVVDSFIRKDCLRAAVKRIGLVVGIPIFASISLFSGCFIWKVKISGNDKVDSLSIERLLKVNGISVGSKKHSLDTFGIRMLLNDMNGIAESSVEIVGTTLKITVFEDTEFTDPDVESVSSLVSAYDARISRIVVEDGTACVNIGDNVACGSELISGEMFDTNGESLGFGNAKGQVYGIVNFTASAIFADSVMKEVDTGNCEVRSYAEIFGWKIGGKKPISYKTFRSVTKKSFLTNLFFPIKYTRTVFYETKRETIGNDVEKLIEDWKKEKILEMIISCGGNETEAIVVSNRIGGGLTKADLFLQAEMPLIK